MYRVRDVLEQRFENTLFEIIELARNRTLVIKHACKRSRERAHAMIGMKWKRDSDKWLDMDCVIETSIMYLQATAAAYWGGSHTYGHTQTHLKDKIMRGFIYSIGGCVCSMRFIVGWLTTFHTYNLTHTLAIQTSSLYRMRELKFAMIFDDKFTTYMFKIG